MMREYLFLSICRYWRAGLCSFMILFCWSAALRATPNVFPQVLQHKLESAPKGIATFSLEAGKQFGAFVSFPALNQVGQLQFSADRGFELISTPVTMIEVGRQPGAIVSGDFNQDGLPDFVVVGEVTSNSIHIANAINSQLLQLLYKTSFSFIFDQLDKLGPNPLALADLNHDGLSEIIALSNQQVGAISQIPSSVADIFAGEERTYAFSFPSSLTTTDFDQDGNLDLAITAFNDSLVDLKFGDGRGLFEHAFEPDQFITLPTEANPFAIATADFNQDQKSDLVVANRGSHSLSVFLGKGWRPQKVGFEGGAELFTTMPPQPVCEIPVDVFPFDANGDQKLDVAVACDSGELQVWLGKGDGTFENTSFFSQQIGAQLYKIVGGDFNLDGTTDLLVSSPGTSSVVTLLGNQPPMLAHAHYNNGTFWVLYTDSENEKPDFIRVLLNGKAYDLQASDPADQDMRDGKGYQVTLALPEGSYECRYEASDGTSLAQGNSVKSTVLNVVDSIPATPNGGGCALNQGENHSSWVFLLGFGVVLGLFNLIRWKKKT